MNILEGDIMGHEKIEILHKTAENFGAIAKKVNDSSRKRKNFSRDALKFIDLSDEIGDELNREIQTVCDTDRQLRDQNNVVLNSCRILKFNVAKQDELIRELRERGDLDEEVYEKIQTKVKFFKESIEEAIKNVDDIIAGNNNIIFMDDLVLMRKKIQKGAISQLRKLTEKSLGDAEKAIDGSYSNLGRGLDMVERFKKVQQAIDNKDTGELAELIEEAERGWTIAAGVNKSSSAQFEFAEEVNKFTKQLHDDSIRIKNMVIDKHNMFEENLQVITVLTVILALKFKKYLDVREAVDDLKIRESNNSVYVDLKVLVHIACNDIEKLAVLNYDMADTSHVNNELEDKTVDSTKKEIEYYDKIKDSVEKMTEATGYPVEGSAENIENGKFLENNLKEIMKNIED